jgi:hypothetical protein
MLRTIRANSRLDRPTVPCTAITQERLMGHRFPTHGQTSRSISANAPDKQAEVGPRGRYGHDWYAQSKSHFTTRRPKASVSFPTLFWIISAVVVELCSVSRRWRTTALEANLVKRNIHPPTHRPTRATTGCATGPTRSISVVIRHGATPTKTNARRRVLRSRSRIEAWARR